MVSVFPVLLCLLGSSVRPLQVYIGLPDLILFFSTFFFTVIFFFHCVLFPTIRTYMTFPKFLREALVAFGGEVEGNVKILVLPP